MSIVTKTGDEGSTGLMFGRRVAKDHPRVEACGAVDELSASLGLARGRAAASSLRERLGAIQRQLITLMGELATAPEDLPRYAQAGFQRVEPEMTLLIEEHIAGVERRLPPPDGWLLPGEDEVSAALHLARTVCRRAERRVAALQRSGDLPNPEPLVYLNRLADLLWLLAREAEVEAAS